MRIAFREKELLRDVEFAANMFLQTELDQDKSRLRGALDRLYRWREEVAQAVKADRSY